MVRTYRVVGGEYAGTNLIVIAGGGAPERLGPFASHESAWF